jgi:PadR family transcriptional regulator, regulatory protein AphA
MCPMVRRPPGIELALLGFLRDGPQHGYHIHLTLSNPAGLGLVWHLKQSQLYALLAKLEGDGYVISALQSQEPHPPRRVFELTPGGRIAYLDWLTSPVAVPRLVRQEFLAKLYFLQGGNKEPARLLIERQLLVCQRWLGDFKRQAAQNETGSYGWLTFQYRIRHIEAMLAWLEVCGQTLA